MAVSNRLSDLKIKKMKTPEKEEWHRDGDGLALRVYPTGAKVWHYIYTNIDSKKRYHRLGEYPNVLKERAGYTKLEVKPVKLAA